ncbi:chitobiase/beta-hexosaminidase C-terminal domain-containing protein [Patescibacteria group bacterium]|nr:chitobiase/beta-hexosaminidase C-terminal domain-containing protein [Patescibacteria group bacterium]
MKTSLYHLIPLISLFFLSIAFLYPTTLSAATTPIKIDVFLIAGQSNMIGNSGSKDSAPTLPASTTYQYRNGKITSVTNTLTPGKGAAWPQFAQSYIGNSTRRVAFIQEAVGGTSQIASIDNGNGNWSTSGKLFNDSVQETTAALAAFKKAGFDPALKGVLWGQGENDAAMINGKRITGDEYKKELIEMIANYRTALGSTTPFYIFQTGTAVDRNDSGFAAVRRAQDEIAATDIYTDIVFRDAITFPNRKMMDNYIHYNQAGYNEMGDRGAKSVIYLQNNKKAPKAPLASVVSGTYTATTTVSLSSTLGSTLLYSLDGQNPTCSRGTTYEKPIVFSAKGSHTLKAVACSVKKDLSLFSIYRYTIK